MTRARTAASWVVACALALAPAAARAQDASVAYAQQRFERAQQHYIARDFAAALAESRASLALYASPNTRLYVARALRELGRLDEAVVEYERTAREARELAATSERYAATHAAAEQELAALERRIGRISVQLAAVPAGVRVQVGPSVLPVAALGLSRPIMPGEVAVAVSAPGYTPFRSIVAVQAGRAQEVFVSLARLPVEPPRRAPLSAGALGVMGAGLALAAVGFGGAGGFWSAATREFANVSAACDPRPCSTRAQLDAVARGETYQAMTNAGLVVGAVGGVAAVAGLIWLIAASAAPSPAPSPRVARGAWSRGGPQVAWGPWGAALAWGARW